jgi:hypothetical protein
MNITDNSPTTEEYNKDKRMYSGFTAFPNIKRTWHLCPRCAHQARRFTVDKDHRVCSNCRGRLYWDGDDCGISNREHEDYYVWHRSIFGMEGWFHSSYFK